MKLIGNYIDWATPELWDILTTTDGDTRKVWQPERWVGHPDIDAARERARAGYAHRDHDFQQFNERTTDLLSYKFTLPIPLTRKYYTWWFIKLYPGQMQAMHVDPHVTEMGKENNVLRYTMFLNDYIPGHIFTYDDKMISNYKAGDLYLWDDPFCYHGVVNIGFDTRYTLQLTMHD